MNNPSQTYNKTLPLPFIKVIQNYCYYVKHNFPIEDKDVLWAILYVLYGHHKQYLVHEGNNDEIFFTNPREDDPLLGDLYSQFRNNRFHSLLLYRKLCEFSYDAFEEAYPDILHALFEAESSSSMSAGEFYSPSAINALTAYFLSSEEYKYIYDPFCGTASLIRYLTMSSRCFSGQEINERTSYLAKVNVDAYPQIRSTIKLQDSVFYWNQNRFDAVVSHLPFGVPLSTHTRRHPSLLADEYMYNSLEELFYFRAFRINNARIALTLEPNSFCHSVKYRRLRQYLVDNNLLDTIVYLPNNSLYGTSIPCIMVVCKCNRDNFTPIKLIDAQSYVTKGGLRNRGFDYDSFVRDLEGKKIGATATRDDIQKYDYNLNPYLYIQNPIELKEGQVIKSFGELMTRVVRKIVAPDDNYRVFPLNNFSSNYIHVLLNKNGLVNTSMATKRTPRKIVHIEGGKKYILAVDNALTKPRYAIYTGTEDFACPQNVRVYEVNEEYVTPEYLAYLLTNNEVLRSKNYPISNLDIIPVVIDCKEKQQEIIDKIIQQDRAEKRKEIEADEKRLGVKTNISDLEHMLGPTQSHLTQIIYDLERVNAIDDTYHLLVKRLSDNVEYMNRLIQFSNANISHDQFNIRQQDIVSFIENYCNAWRNYSGNYFNLSLVNKIGESRNVMFDRTLMKVMLDSILSNAERHGFGKRKNEENKVEISLNMECYEDRPFVLLRVANNGKPFNEGFTLKEYITRGRYSSDTGRSGLGGYHVYSIAKGHRGYLYIDSTKVWSVIVEILLPISGVETDNLTEYEHECI